jgi:hypothetical protein
MVGFAAPSSTMRRLTDEKTQATIKSQHGVLQ